MTTTDRWPGAEPLETAELVLEPLRVEHAEEMVSVLADPRLYAFTGGRPPALEELRERYRRQSLGRSCDGAERWFNWVLRHRADRRAVGYVQATVRVEAAGEDPLRMAEVAWVVGTAYQGRGHARRAVAAMVSWLRAHGVDQIVAHVHPDHRASMAVASSTGMRPTDLVVDGEVRWVG